MGSSGDGSGHESNRQVLKQQEPHSALVLDRYWNVIRTNEAAPRFFGSFADLDARKKPRNLLDLMLDPAGMRPFVEPWGSRCGRSSARSPRNSGPCRGSKDGGAVEKPGKISGREGTEPNSEGARPGHSHHLRRER